MGVRAEWSRQQVGHRGLCQVPHGWQVGGAGCGVMVSVLAGVEDVGQGGEV